MHAATIWLQLSCLNLVGRTIIMASLGRYRHLRGFAVRSTQVSDSGSYVWLLEEGESWWRLN